MSKCKLHPPSSESQKRATQQSCIFPGAAALPVCAPAAPRPAQEARPSLALLEQRTSGCTASQMQQKPGFLKHEQCRFKWFSPCKLSFLVVTTVDNYVASKCLRRFLGFCFLGLGFFKFCLPNSVLSVGLYHVFEDSWNLEKQLNCWCDIKMHYFKHRQS